MIPTVQECLSEKTLFSIIRSKSRFGFWGSNTTSAKVNAITDEECDAVLTPLIDYFEKNLSILHDHLREGVMTLVITKLWKRILFILEARLTPPLSDELSTMTPLTESETHILYKT